MSASLIIRAGKSQSNIRQPNSLEESIDSLIATTKRKKIEINPEMGATKDVTLNNPQQSLDNSFYRNSEMNQDDELSQKRASLMSSDSKKRKMSVKEKFHTTIISQIDETMEDRNFTVINEVNEGKYFGEISILTNLPAT